MRANLVVCIGTYRMHSGGSARRKRACYYRHRQAQSNKGVVDFFVRVFLPCTIRSPNQLSEWRAACQEISAMYWMQTSLQLASSFTNNIRFRNFPYCFDRYIYHCNDIKSILVSAILTLMIRCCTGGLVTMCSS